MQFINMSKAKSTLSRLVEAIEHGDEDEIILTRHGRPVAKLVPVRSVESKQRLGVAKGVFAVPDSIDRSNVEVAQLFATAEFPRLQAGTSRTDKQ